jgi:hypothetical protein
VEPSRATWVRAVQVSEAAPAVAPSKRNGHAVVVGRVLELALEAQPLGDVARTVSLSLADERLLRDGDERQLGEEGVAIARGGSTADWRDLLRVHFHRRYGLRVVFEAATTTVV